jgi:hypothetical protein
MLVWHVEHVEDIKSAYKISVGNLNRRCHLEYLSLDGKVKLNWIGNKGWTRVIWLKTGTGGRLS